MLLGQELKFKNKLCNLKLGTFFSALTGMWLGACRLFLFYIAKVIKIFNIIVVLNKNYIFFDMEE